MAQQADDSVVAGHNHWTTLDSFPELWAEILKRVPQADRLRHVPLVSRRFSEACRDPAAWPELYWSLYATFSEALWQSFLRWLAVRGSGLQAFEFCILWEDDDDADYGAWEQRAPELIALLAAAAPKLRSLLHWYLEHAPEDPASALPSDLGRLSQLTLLHLDIGRAPVTTAQVDAMVQTLPSLQHLAVVGSQDSMAVEFPLSISSCSQLKLLEIRGGQLGAVPPELGRLTGLTRLVLQGNVTSLPDIMSRLSALVCLETDVQLPEVLPAGFWRLPGLTQLRFLSKQPASLPGSISRLLALQDLRLQSDDMSDLPPGLSECRQLTLLFMMFDARSPVLASLQSLRHLSICVRQGRGEPHWTQLTALMELQLGIDGEHSILPALRSMTCLRKLGIYCSAPSVFPYLPAGQYLNGLQSLTLAAYITAPAKDLLDDVRPKDDVRVRLRKAHVRWLGAFHGIVHVVGCSVAFMRF